MKVVEFEVGGECAICGEDLEGDPYRLTTKGGEVFEVCDRCSHGLFRLLQAEGVEGVPAVPTPPAPRPRWHL